MRLKLMPLVYPSKNNRRSNVWTEAPIVPAGVLNYCNHVFYVSKIIVEKETGRNGNANICVTQPGQENLPMYSYVNSYRLSTKVPNYPSTRSLLSTQLKSHIVGFEDERSS